MRAASQKTFRELAVGLGALVAAVLVQTAIVSVTINHLQAADRDDDEARAEVFQFAAMTEAADEEQAGLLAWRLGGGPQAAAAYTDAHARFLAGVSPLRGLTAEDPPAMRAHVEDAIRQEAAWTREVAEPQIEALRGGRTPPVGAPLGLASLDRLREDFNVLRRRELDLLDSRDHIWRDAFHDGRLALLMGAVAALLLAGGLAWRSF